MIGAGTHLRVARPVRDLDVSARFYVAGLGLQVLARIAATPGTEERDLLIVGPAGGGWHLELTSSDDDPIEPAPTPEDLLVVYLGSPAPTEVIERLTACGGQVVAAHNPYWDSWGVTVQDPDGYRVVLSERTWISREPGADAG